jgi:hypothetical protein
MLADYCDILISGFGSIGIDSGIVPKQLHGRMALVGR